MNRVVALVVWLSLTCCVLVWAGTEGAVARNEAGGDFFRKGKFDEAIVEFKRALQEDADYLPARLNLAHAYERLGRIDEAIREYRAFLTLEPGHFLARNNLGVLYDKTGRYDEAIVEFNGALKIEPGNGMARKNLETARKNKAILEDRHAHLERAEKLAQAKPNDSQASYHVARLHASFGNKTLALQWLDRALKQGYKEIASVKTDTAFSSLQGDREFELMLLGK